MEINFLYYLLFTLIWFGILIVYWGISTYLVIEQRVNNKIAFVLILINEILSLLIFYFIFQDIINLFLGINTFSYDIMAMPDILRISIMALMSVMFNVIFAGGLTIIGELIDLRNEDQRFSKHRYADMRWPKNLKASVVGIYLFSNIYSIIMPFYLLINMGFSVFPILLVLLLSFIPSFLYFLGLIFIKGFASMLAPTRWDRIRGRYW